MTVMFLLDCLFIMF